MTSLTISKKLTKGEELVIVPLREYEAFSNWRSTFKHIKEFTPTTAQLSILRRARQDYRLGKTLTLNEFKRQLARRNKGAGK